MREGWFIWSSTVHYLYCDPLVNMTENHRRRSPVWILFATKFYLPFGDWGRIYAFSWAEMSTEVRDATEKVTGQQGWNRKGDLGTSRRNREEEAPESSREQRCSQVKQGTEWELYVVCYSSEALEISEVRERKEEKSTLQKCVCVVFKSLILIYLSCEYHVFFTFFNKNMH